MNTDTQISIALIISTVTFVFNSIIFFKGQKKYVQSENEIFTEIKLKLDMIEKNTIELKNESRDTRNRVDEISKEQIIQKENIKALWKQVDKLNEEEK
jgi:hypothetical protein